MKINKDHLDSVVGFVEYIEAYNHVTMCSEDQEKFDILLKEVVYKLDEASDIVMDSFGY